MNVREISLKEVNQVCNLIKEKHYFQFLQHTIYTSPNISNYLEKLVNEPSHYLYGAFSGDKLLGAIHFVLQSNKCLFLNHIVVSESALKLGLGKKLISLFLDFDLPSGATWKLNVDSRNVTAIEWYKRLDFKEIYETAFSLVNFESRLNIPSDLIMKNISNIDQYKSHLFSHINFEGEQLGLVNGSIISVPIQLVKNFNKIDKTFHSPNYLLPISSKEQDEIFLGYTDHQITNWKIKTLEFRT